MKHKKGTKVKIINTNDDTTHGFREGEIVTITNVDDGLGGSYRADSDGDFWWITDGECVALGEAPSPELLEALRMIQNIIDYTTPKEQIVPDIKAVLKEIL
jgi:hypothetical protein